MPAPKLSAAVGSLPAAKARHPQGHARHGPERSASGTAVSLADCPAMVRFLNQALATEIVCALRYRHHHFVARSLGARRVAEEFLLHADEELSQADLIAERIVQLGGQPDFAPDTLTERSHLAYAAGGSVAEMLGENLAATRLAIEQYRGLMEASTERDPPSRRLLEGILALKHSHADELLNLLQEE